MSRIILVSGAGASGKSEYAEKLAVDMHKDRLIYVATMSAYDDESKKKINIHKKRRINTDFETIEKPYDIEEIIHSIAPCDSNKRSTLLIECISNLLANEMYGRAETDGMTDICGKTETGVKAGTCSNSKLKALPSQRIIDGIKAVADTQLADIVVVTNEVFADGIEYDASTMEYIRQLGRINCELATMSDTVVEVACGRPVVWKGQ